MKIIKPIFTDIEWAKEAKDSNSNFFNTSHTLTADTELTLCSVACEAWDYERFISADTITCDLCIDVIKHNAQYLKSIKMRK